MLGHRFGQYEPPLGGKANFENLLKLFLQLLTYTSGDVSDALDWMNQLDRQYGLTDDNYGMGDFIRDLEAKGYIRQDNPNGNPGQFVPTARMERALRQSSLEEVFGKLRKAGKGQHHTPYTGQGDELTSDVRPFQFGDTLEQIQLTESIRNAQINHGVEGFHLTEDDLSVNEREHRSTTATALMIDISHSMILYGEDRITPAKKVAMALAELITTQYPKDTLDILVFGNDAWPIEIKDLPYLQVGPYHTNTVAGLELALDLLRRRKATNRQIIMITDGKPSCLKEGNQYYKNSFGLDRKIVNRCLNLAAQSKRLHIPITTFMIAEDPYLQRFVREFTETNGGRAFYSSLDGLGGFLLEDFERNRRRKVR